MAFQSLLKPEDIPLRARNIHRLRTNFSYQLRRLQPVLLFLFIKYWPDAAIGVVGIPAQVIDTLLLFIGITDGDVALRYRRLSGAFRMTAPSQS
ncbi:Uncharacterised protein [Yersinia bercovieri]|nr:Uncharacterised protein [Yersinia bercovieri]